MSARPVRDLAIEALFAPLVVRAYTADVGSDFIAELDDGELREAGAMGSGRRAEFATGRACARAALADLSTPGSVGRDERGAPRWPSGVVGSISHTRGRCVAIASTAKAAVGIDIEEIDRVKTTIERRILVDAERDWLGDYNGRSRQALVAAVFATKEAFYKAHHGLYPRYLGFGAIIVRQGADGTMALQATPGGAEPDATARATARVRFDGDLAIAAVTIAATDTKAPPLHSPE